MLVTVYVLRRLRANAEIRDQAEVEGIVAKLVDEETRPALRMMGAALGKSSNLKIDPTFFLSIISRERATVRAHGISDSSPMGELFFRRDRAFLMQPVGNYLHIAELRRHDAPPGIDDFAERVTAAARGSLDGRRLRGMKFEWDEVIHDAAAKAARRRRTGRSQSDLQVECAEYSDDDLTRATLVADADNRAFLRAIAGAGAKVRRSDVVLSESKLKELMASGFLREEYLLVCRKDNSKTICSVANRMEIETTALRCSLCDRPFSEELIHELYTLTEDGKRMLNGSKWMTIWVTSILVSAGVPQENVSWNCAAGEDEIDIIADLIGFRIFFELKDREFGLGDAYPFTHRVDRYGGNAGVIVTTDKIAEEVQQFLREARGNSLFVPIDTVEGSVQIPGDLTGLVDRLSQTAVSIALDDVTYSLGINLGPLLRRWMKRRVV